MISFDRGIISYTDRYLAGRSVDVIYAGLVRGRIARFCEWAGTDVAIDAVSCDLANDWLLTLEKSGMNKWTLSGYRASLLAVWKEAYLAGENENAPFRLRKVKKPRLIIEAYTHDELSALLTAAEKLPGLHANDNRASDFWTAAIHVGYSCGARLGDVLTLEWRHVEPTGRLRFVQHKTQYDHTVKLSMEAIKAARKLGESKFVLPYPYQKTWFCKNFKLLRDAAGVKRGTFKWIRRAAGSYAEREQKGAGASLLGHRDGRMFKRHYEDSSISGDSPVEPPRIKPK